MGCSHATALGTPAAMGVNQCQDNAPHGWLASSGLDEEQAELIDTLIFLDVDGVLNVGAHDPGKPPILLRAETIRDASRLFEARAKHPLKGTIERVYEISHKSLGHGEDATYTKLACKGDEEVSDLLVKRFVSLVQSAGTTGGVVLSSKWRRSKARRDFLESTIAEQLGAPFTFHGWTLPLEDPCTPESRLRMIGDFVHGLSSWRSSRKIATGLRLLVLEDFHIHGFGWKCDGRQIDSIEAAEEYLQSRAAGGTSCSAKLIHTYDEWTSTSNNLHVQVATGLTLQHMCQAIEFLSGEAGTGCLRSEESCECIRQGCSNGLESEEKSLPPCDGQDSTKEIWVTMDPDNGKDEPRSQQEGCKRPRTALEDTPEGATEHLESRKPVTVQRTS
mmetsp:Transcript_41321/g.74714  ORF Transcript_41321/g.74714 Transcript_41321/m.74714 type:complete len:389 (-) Transcript_41321:79-1245(-)